MTADRPRDPHDPSRRAPDGEGPLPLHLLDPAPLAGARHEALARRIEAAAAPALERRALRARAGAGAAPIAPTGDPTAGVLPLLARALRPALLGAAAALLAAVGLARGASEPPPAPAAEVTVAQALEPGDGGGWIAERRVPSNDDLAESLGGRLWGD